MAQVNKVHVVRTLALVARGLRTDEDDTMAFTDTGVENLATLIGDLGSSRPHQPDGS